MNAPANPNKALWEKGDFTRIADTMRESGEALVQRLGITKGLKVLDLGCGDGTTALPAAKLGADVSGIDIARNLEDAGDTRAADGIPKGNISFARDTFTFNCPGTPSQLLDEFRKYYGPTMNAFEAAEKQGRAAELQKELQELFNSQNKGQEGTSIPATFLRVTVAV